ncbi:hypothetical protein D3C80_1830030 [compost metagenome]
MLNVLTDKIVQGAAVEILQRRPPVEIRQVVINHADRHAVDAAQRAQVDHRIALLT